MIESVGDFTIGTVIETDQDEYVLTQRTHSRLGDAHLYLTKAQLSDLFHLMNNLYTKGEVL